MWIAEFFLEEDQDPKEGAKREASQPRPEKERAADAPSQVSDRTRKGDGRTEIASRDRGDRTPYVQS
jgi:hypothetical protein